MLTEISGTCQYENCDKPATTIASGRGYCEKPGHPIACYCSEHAHIVATEGHPEYLDDCPNCGCLFGVN